MNEATTPILLAAPASAADLSMLTEALDKAAGAPVAIDLQSVSALTSVHLQVLLAAQKGWEADDTHFEVVNISDDCRRSMTLLGLEPNHFKNEGV